MQNLGGQTESIMVFSELAYRPYSYSQYWTGTSLQWRLMRDNILKTSSNQRLGSAFYIMCSVIIEKWVV